MISTESLVKMRELLRDAGALEGFFKHYATKYEGDGRCDEKGYGFGFDSRFAAFKISTTFDSWAGYYGNSGCGKILTCNQDQVSGAFVKAMNEHANLLFATAAKFMREEASKLRSSAESEIAKMQELLAELPDQKTSQ